MAEVTLTEPEWAALKAEVKRVSDLEDEIKSLKDKHLKEIKEMKSSHKKEIKDLISKKKALVIKRTFSFKKEGVLEAARIAMHTVRFGRMHSNLVLAKIRNFLEGDPEEITQEIFINTEELEKDLEKSFQNKFEVKHKSLLIDLQNSEKLVNSLGTRNVDLLKRISISHDESDIVKNALENCRNRVKELEGNEEYCMRLESQNKYLAKRLQPSETIVEKILLCLNGPPSKVGNFFWSYESYAPVIAKAKRIASQYIYPDD